MSFRTNLRRVILPVLVALLLSSLWMRRAAQGQTGSTGLNGSWVGTATIPGQPAQPILWTYSSNGTVTEVIQGGGCGGNDSVGVGSWVSTANGQFSQTTVHFNCEMQNYAGNFKVRASFSLNGSQMSGSGEAIVSDPTGAVQQDLTGITVTATQIAVEPIGSM